MVPLPGKPSLFFDVWKWGDNRPTALGIVAQLVERLELGGFATVDFHAPWR